MPLYSYFCYEEKGGCGYEFDEYFSIDDRCIPLRNPCPNCDKKDTVCRKLTTASVVDSGIINADKNMELSGVQKNLERIRDNHPKANMKWKG